MFSEERSLKSRMTQLEKDRKLILTAMKTKIQFSLKTGTPVERPSEQGSPCYLQQLRESNKSYATKSLWSRYKDACPQVFTSEYPWQPPVLHNRGNVCNTYSPSRKSLSSGGLCKFTHTQIYSDKTQ